VVFHAIPKRPSDSKGILKHFGRVMRRTCILTETTTDKQLKPKTIPTLQQSPGAQENHSPGVKRPVREAKHSP